MGIPMLIPLIPTLGWSWPALAPILVGTAGSLGYGLITTRVQNRHLQTALEKQIQNLRIVEIPLEEHVKGIVAEQLGHEEELQFQKDDLTLTFRHDARGKFHVRVLGPKHRTLTELRMIGDEFARELIQQFAYNRIARELDRRGVQVVEEAVDEQGNIVLTTRRW